MEMKDQAIAGNGGPGAQEAGHMHPHLQMQGSEVQSVPLADSEERLRQVCGYEPFSLYPPPYFAK
jgi:hypothetical protein